MERVKLTKSAIGKFLIWSTSRYNNYCGYGTKKENVDIIYASLKNGCLTDYRGNRAIDKTVFTVSCAGSVGESGTGRSWKIKQGGGDYEVDCLNATVKEKWSGREIGFAMPNSTPNVPVSDTTDDASSNEADNQINQTK